MTPIRPGAASFAVSSLLFACFALSASLLGQAPSAAGRWVGSLDVVHPDGSVDPGDAYVALTQNGETLTGSAGQSADKQSPLSVGTISGNSVAFALAVNPRMTVRFDLTLAGDHLRGTAAGLPVEAGAKIVVDLVRAGDDWHSTAPIVHAPDRLFDTVAALDTRLFDAYNTCDLATMSTMVSEDLEFYHDKTGLAVGRQVFLDAIKNNICGKVNRVIVPGTLEVHRLDGFGAMEIVTHRFTHPGHEAEFGVGEARSIMLWRFKDGRWQATRVISYDHGAAKN